MQDAMLRHAAMRLMIFVPVKIFPWHVHFCWVDCHVVRVSSVLAIFKGLRWPAADGVRHSS